MYQRKPCHSRASVLVTTYIKAVIVLHQGIVKQMSVNLRLDQNQVNEEHYKIMLNVFITEVAAVSTHSQANIVAARFVVGFRVFGP